jgi:hypothetical protein
MKKTNIIFTVLAVIIFLGTAHSQTDYGKAIIGTWKFDLGSGFMATIEYKSDGTFEQKVDEMIIGGTYVVKGDKLKTVTKGQTTIFTIVSMADNKMTVKRVKDGRTIVYNKQ